MVRLGDAVGAAAASVGLTVTRLISYNEKNGIPPLNVLYTSDEDQAWYFLRNRLNSSVLGLDMQWKPVLKGKPTSRSSLLQIAAGDWVLIYDVLPTPWYGTPAQPLSERMCDFLQEKGRTFYGMILPVDAARIAFELDCVISRGVDLRKNPWPGANTTGGMVHLGNQLLGTTVREDRKVAISNWEWRPMTGQQLRYMAEKTYLSWAIAKHFLKKKGRPSKDAMVTKAQIYGAGARLRKAGLAIEDTEFDWSKAKKQWLREVKRRKEEAEAAEAAAAAEEAKAEKKRQARELRAKKKSSKAKAAEVEEAASAKKEKKRREAKAAKKASAAAEADSAKESRRKKSSKSAAGSKASIATEKESSSRPSRKSRPAKKTETIEVASESKKKRATKKSDDKAEGSTRSASRKSGKKGARGVAVSA